ncbi:MAG: acetolactate synthase [Planctomycetales bacterium]|nr:acetolactate synthase [Planctomycetales bacterium]
MSSGEGLGTNYMTSRGRDYPAITQFTVFLENRVGQLMEVVRRFEGSNVRIVALTISDSTECALVRFVLSDPEVGREILERAGLALVETELVGVELPHTSQPMLQVCTALLAAEVNITQVYPLLMRPTNRPSVAIMVDNIEHALETLESKGFHLIHEDELKEME